MWSALKTVFNRLADLVADPAVPLHRAVVYAAMVLAVLALVLGLFALGAQAVVVQVAEPLLRALPL